MRRAFSTFVFLTLAAMASVRADDTPAAAIAKLQDARRDKIAGALKVLDEQYADALKNLQKRAMQAGDLDSAVALKKEIDALTDPAADTQIELSDALGRDARKTPLLRQSAGFLAIRNKRAAELTGPIGADYRKAVEALMKSTLAGGDIDGAIFVKKELARLDAPAAMKRTGTFGGTRWFNAHADGGPCTLVFKADGTFIQFYHNRASVGTWKDNGANKCTGGFGGSNWRFSIDKDDPDVIVRSDKQHWRLEPPGRKPGQSVPGVDIPAEDAGGTATKPAASAGPKSPSVALGGTRWFNARAVGGPCTLVFKADGTFIQFWKDRITRGTWSDKEADGRCAVKFDGYFFYFTAEDRNPDVLVRNDGQHWRRESPDRPPAQSIPGIDTAATDNPETKPDSGDTPKPAPKSPSDDTPFGRRI